MSDGRPSSVSGSAASSHPGRRLRPVLLLLLAAGLAVVGVLAVSSDTEVSERTGSKVELDLDNRAAVVGRGGIVEIRVGEVNGSIGDIWELVDVSPSASVASVVEEYRDVPDCPTGMTGCSNGTLVFVVEVADDAPAGKVAFTVQNCYRGLCPGEAGADSISAAFKFELSVRD